MVFEKIRSIFAKQLGIVEDHIELESSIKNDLGVDSLDTVDILMNIEEEFDLNIPGNKLGDTVGDIVNFVEKEIGFSREKKSA